MKRVIDVWYDILIFLNTLDTALGAIFLLGSWFGFRAWWRNRRVEKERETLGATRTQEAPSDADERPGSGEGL
jgi:hypothetical protein